MRAAILILGLNSALGGAHLTAQHPVPLGARVRISAPTLGLHGREGFLDPDSVLILNRGHRLAVPLHAVTKLHVQSGSKSRTIRGAFIGLAIGAGGGAIVGAIAEVSGERFCVMSCAAAGTLTAISATVNGIYGAVIGTVAGSFTKAERWEEVPLDRLRVSFAPQGDRRFALGLTVSF